MKFVQDSKLTDSHFLYQNVYLIQFIQITSILLIRKNNNILPDIMSGNILSGNI